MVGTVGPALERPGMGNADELANMALHPTPPVSLARRSRRGAPLVRQPEQRPGILRIEESRMSWQEHITVNPSVMHGKACIRGTRIPVAVVLANLADGLSPEEIIRSYPSLTHEAIQATLVYAAELAQERVLPLPA